MRIGDVVNGRGPQSCILSRRSYVYNVSVLFTVRYEKNVWTFAYVYTFMILCVCDAKL